MRALIVEDEFVGRTILEGFLQPFFNLDVVVNGAEAIEAFELAHKQGNPYTLVFLDIMMPEVDGLKALERIRESERRQGFDPVFVIMTTALSDPKTVLKSIHDFGADSYLVKPLDKQKILAELEKFDLIGK